MWIIRRTLHSLAKFGPRGVLKCKATATENPAPPDPRFGAWGKQTCEDTGPLTIERMKTVDEEFLAATLDDMDRSVKAGKPFFIWHNTTRMHIWTHLQPKYEAMIGQVRPLWRRACRNSTTTSAYCSRSSMIWGSQTTPSSSSAATTGPK